MTDDMIERATRMIGGLSAVHALGQVVAVSGGLVDVAGFPDFVRLGDRVRILSTGAQTRGEAIHLSAGRVRILPEGGADGVSIGDRVRLDPPQSLCPHDDWIGRVIDPDGRPLDIRPLLPGKVARPVRANPPSPYQRRPMGARIGTGFAVLNTLLPIARGQRLGLFAGSGVGKSTLLADLARTVEADVIVIALVGERGREVREFIDVVLGPEGMKRSVVVAATSDRAPQVRRRCAWTATAVAEHFRDTGRHVLLLVDSVTRFAEAHRELAVASGEVAGLRGFPASTGATIAALCERAGPGTTDTGDITAIYTVLVAGSDMEEPVADMLRGVLDGHIVLDRTIAERGRFPAIDLLRSVSRCLPGVATDAENQAIAEARGHLGAHDRSELMIQSGLYTAGSDPKLDQAIAVKPALEKFLALKEGKGIPASFAALKQVLGSASGGRRPS